MAGYGAVRTTGKPPESLKDAAEASWLRAVAEAVNRVIGGKVNVTLDITLTTNADTTIIIDARIAAYSSLHLQPLTANAAAALVTAPYVLVQTQQSGQVIFAHANDANTDKNFRMTILGG